MQRFTEFRAWQAGHAFVIDLYAATNAFPGDERYGIRAQLRKAAVSITSNIAEGSRRNSDADFARFVTISEGSVAECESLLMTCRDLGFLATPVCDKLLGQLTRVGRMLHGLRLTLSSGRRKPATEAFSPEP